MSDEKKKPTPTQPCPKCGAHMVALLFMGVQPDGWVCQRCRAYVSPTGELLGVVLG